MLVELVVTVMVWNTTYVLEHRQIISWPSFSNLKSPEMRLSYLVCFAQHNLVNQWSQVGKGSSVVAVPLYIPFVAFLQLGKVSSFRAWRLRRHRCFFWEVVPCQDRYTNPRVLIPFSHQTRWKSRILPRMFRSFNLLKKASWEGATWYRVYPRNRTVRNYPLCSSTSYAATNLAYENSWYIWKIARHEPEMTRHTGLFIPNDRTCFQGFLTNCCLFTTHLLTFC